MWVSGGIDPHILNLALDGGEWSAKRPKQFYSLDDTLDGFHSLSACLNKRKICVFVWNQTNIAIIKLTLWNRSCFEKLILFFSSQKISCF
jgi:hypothetical protein